MNKADMFDEMLALCEKIVQWYGKRDIDDPDDKLLPWEQQEDEIKEIMTVIDKAKELQHDN